MPPLPRTTMLICFALLGCVFIAFNIHSAWSLSVDLAHHYALVARISEHHAFSGVIDPSLGEMNYYPRASHLMASVAAVFLKSDFLGIQCVSLISIVLLWGSILYLISLLPGKIAGVSALLLGSVLIFNQYFVGLEVFGFEVLGNFFYSQLVAQAAVTVVIAIGVFLEIRKRQVLSYLIISFFVVFITSIHLLPALELFATLLGLIFLDVLGRVLSKKNFKISAIVFIIIIALAVLGVYFNPAFKAMRQISENNGGLELAYVSYPLGLGALCILASCMSVAMLTVSYKSSGPAAVAIKYFSLYGAGVSALCLVQTLLVHFGMGSEYAAKKYAFGLFSFLVVSVVGFVAAGLCRFSPDNPFGKTTSHWVFLASTLLGFTLLLAGAVPPRSNVAVDEIVIVEQNLNEMARRALPPAGNGRSNVAIALPNMAQTVNYMFSIAALNTLRTLAIPDVLISSSLTDLHNYGYIVTGIGSGYDKGQCRVNSGQSLAVIDSQCLAGEVQRADICSGLIDFSSAGLLDTKRIEGMGHAEETGRWTVGPDASFTCLAGGKRVTEATLDLQPFLAGRLKSQHLRISVNGDLVLDKVFAYDVDNGPVVIKLPEINEGAGYKLAFSTPDAVSPKALGISTDDRPLGFFIRSIVFK